MVKESSAYDNYLDPNAKKNDIYRPAALPGFEDDDIKVDIKEKEKKTKSDVWKSIYVHFRNTDDIVEFCTKINQIIPGKDKETYFPVVSLFGDEESVKVLPEMVAPPKKHKVNGRSDKWKEYWLGMPEYEQEDNPPHRSLTMKFRTEKDFKDFAERIGQDLSDDTKSIWYPKLEITKNLLLRWIQPNGRTNPRHPCYIVSKGRADTMLTSRSLARMQVPHYIVVEPQDMKDYDQALDNFNIRPYVTLLEAPFSNHGDGPGRARNWAWDHSISIGATSHWVFDDNISDFYRLHKNQRIRFESGVGFQVMEDFVDRYENVYVSGPQYRFFIAPDSKYPAFVTNTRVYSTLLIRNDCKHRWRGRYNEDTDLCLRVMKDGDVCVQFNAFLQGKSATQTVKGGNTAEFYHAENTDNEEFKETGYNTDGTINKSKMLVDMHPDVAQLVWKYGRWHHHVNYEPFKKNKLILKQGVSLPTGVNNYGMELVTNFDWKAVH